MGARLEDAARGVRRARLTTGASAAGASLTRGVAAGIFLVLLLLSTVELAFEYRDLRHMERSQTGAETTLATESIQKFAATPAGQALIDSAARHAAFIALLLAAFAFLMNRRAARAVARRFDPPANLTHAGILIADANGRVVWINAGFERLTGFRRETMIGRTAADIRATHEKPIGAIAALENCMNLKEGHKVDIVGHTQDGREYRASIEVRPILDETGAIRNFFVIENDITEAKAAEAALEQSGRQLRRRIDELQMAKRDLELKLERATLARMPKDRAPAAPAMRASDQPELSGASALDVLLAEDQPVNQKLMTAVMERLGHRLTIAGNGAEALRWLKTRSFDLVLMDIQMPELDGINATKVIRSSDQAWRDIPIIAVTAHAAESQCDTYLAAGMDGFVPKPIRIDVLVSEMNRVILREDRACCGPKEKPAATDTPATSAQAADRGEALASMLDEIDNLMA